MSPRRSIALMVLRLADSGRISSLSFNRRRTGLPPSEAVSSWYPSWMCESRSCSVSVSLDGRLAAFFFAILHVHYGGLILYVAKSYYWGFGAAANSISLPKAKPRAIGL